jgi:transketolase
VAIAVEARKLLAERGIPARVVSVPCFELFLAAPAERRQTVIGGAAVRVAVEAAVRQGWDEIVGSDGIFVGMTGFGASAPYKDLYAHFGITAAAVAEAASTKLGVK